MRCASAGWSRCERARRARLMVVVAGALAFLACGVAFLPAWRETEPPPVAARRTCPAARARGARSALLPLPRRIAHAVLLTVGDVPVFEEASRVLVAAVRLRNALVRGW